MTSCEMTANYAVHQIAVPIDSVTTLELISLHLDYDLRNFPGAPGVAK